MQRTPLVLFLMLAAACGPSSRAPRPTYDRNNISRAEIDTRPSGDMLSTVRALRPNWLSSNVGRPVVGRTVTNSAADAPVAIYLDGKEFGTMDMMKSLSTESVQSVRYYGLSEAQSRFGLRVRSPVIDIISRKP